ncbi:shikimate kinase 1 [Actinomycetes bacterium]|nr:shikimate kinase 1 [Actinomycetes bacterium]
MKLLLIGAMGAGKSTIGQILAYKLGCPYFDNDTEISVKYGNTREKLATLSVKELHDLETQYLIDVLKRTGSFISGAAASVIDRESNRNLISETVGVYLRLPLDKIIERAGTHGIGRQGLTESGTQILVDRFKARDPLYKSTAKLTINLSDSAEKDAEKIVAFLSSLE